MFWTPELASYLEDAPWPATKEELIDYCSRTCAAQQVIDNLLELEDNDELYEGMEDLWPEYESAVDDLYFNEDEENDGRDHGSAAMISPDVATPGSSGRPSPLQALPTSEV